MARFRYRMQNILDIKIKLETQARNEFAQANLELEEEKEKLAELFRKNDALLEEARQLRLKDSLSIRDIEDNKLSTELMKEAMRRQALAVNAAENRLEEKRLAMVQLMQDRKTHEILRQKAFDEFLMEEKAEESKQIDQLTSYTYGRT